MNASSTSTSWSLPMVGRASDDLRAQLVSHRHFPRTVAMASLSRDLAPLASSFPVRAQADEDAGVMRNEMLEWGIGTILTGSYADSVASDESSDA